LDKNTNVNKMATRITKVAPVATIIILWTRIFINKKKPPFEHLYLPRRFNYAFN